MENCCKIEETVISMTRHIAENSGVHSSTENVKPPHVLVKTAPVATVGVDGNTRATVAPEKRKTEKGESYSAFQPH